jgi:DNA modification methylase
MKSKQTENIKATSLIADDKNFNKGSENGAEMIRKSFEKFGAGRSILLDKNNRIIAGNKSVEFSGIDDVLIVESDGTQLIAVKRTDIDLDSPQGREMALADNASAKANIVFDAELIEAELGEAVCVEWGIDVTKKLEAVEDDFEVPADGIETDIVLGDLFEIGEHRLLCGDSTDSDAVARLMNGQKADMVFTDPPYGMKLNADYSGAKSSLSFFGEKGVKGGKKYDNVIGDHDDFTPELINTIFACFNDCKEIFIWGADYFAELLPNKNDGSWVVWDKRANGNDDLEADKSSDKMYGSTFELCWSKNKHKRDIARVKWAGIFGTEKEFDHKRHHPTQKPSLLPQWFFNKWGKENDLIADVFLGSGSTMVASHQLKRKCYGMELDPKYCQVIIDRMRKLDPTLIIKRNGNTIT